MLSAIIRSAGADLRRMPHLFPRKLDVLSMPRLFALTTIGSGCKKQEF